MTTQGPKTTTDFTPEQLLTIRAIAENVQIKIAGEWGGSRDDQEKTREQELKELVKGGNYTEHEVDLYREWYKADTQEKEEKKSQRKSKRSCNLF